MPKGIKSRLRTDKDGRVKLTLPDQRVFTLKGLSRDTLATLGIGREILDHTGRITVRRPEHNTLEVHVAGENSGGHVRGCRFCRDRFVNAPLGGQKSPSSPTIKGNNIPTEADPLGTRVLI